MLEDADEPGRARSGAPPRRTAAPPPRPVRRIRSIRSAAPANPVDEIENQFHNCLAFRLWRLIGASLARARDWFAGGGFGPRRFTSELALLVIGYAALLDALPGRVRWWLAATAGVLLALHQWLLLRYGLAERLGGTVISMAPEFAWRETSLGEFAADLLAAADRAWQAPLDWLVFAGSPLDTLLRDGQWPVQHAAAVLGVSVARRGRGGTRLADL